VNIAVFGSSAPSKPDTYKIRNTDKFNGFCRSLGKWIAQNGHRLIVESDTEGTADREVADGAAQEGGPAGRIEVFWRGSRAEPPFSAHSHQHAFQVTRVPDTLLGVVHHKMLRKADAVVVIGGGRNTHNAGLAAAFTKARLLPVGMFGGAGEALLTSESELKTQTPARLPAPEIISDLKVSSADVTLRAVTSELNDYPRIMIVHGRGGDHDVVERLLKQCGVLTATILAKQPLSGKTIVDEFAHYARLSEAAVVLFTPDDVVATALDPHGTLAETTATRMRARQNVILEYGWFWGAIGRERTLMLLKEDLEVPSDLHGLRYVHYSKTPEEALPQLKRFIESVRHTGHRVGDEYSELEAVR
jgi:predicted nucleotide-binding protein